MWRVAGESTSLVDGQALDVFVVEQDSVAPVEMDISRSEVAQALVAAAVVVVFDEGFNLRLEIIGQIVDFEQSEADQQTRRGSVCPPNVLQGLMPALDLALCLGVAG